MNVGDLLGRTLGNYHLVDRLGKGAFGAVYLGKHTHLETQAAIKVLHDVDAENPEKFLQEARMLAKLKHSHIVRIHDFDVKDGIPYMVMDYVRHGSLEKAHPLGTRVYPHMRGLKQPIGLPVDDIWSLTRHAVQSHDGPACVFARRHSAVGQVRTLVCARLCPGSTEHGAHFFTAKMRQCPATDNPLLLFLLLFALLWLAYLLDCSLCRRENLCQEFTEPLGFLLL